MITILLFLFIKAVLLDPISYFFCLFTIRLLPRNFVVLWCLIFIFKCCFLIVLQWFIVFILCFQLLQYIWDYYLFHFRHLNHINLFRYAHLNFPTHFYQKLNFMPKISTVKAGFIIIGGFIEIAIAKKRLTTIAVL